MSSSAARAARASGGGRGGGQQGGGLHAQGHSLVPAGFEHVAHPVFFALPNKTPCAICLEAEKEHTARLGRCKHQFCFECIAQVRRSLTHTHATRAHTRARALFALVANDAL